MKYIEENRRRGEAAMAKYVGVAGHSAESIKCEESLAMRKPKWQKWLIILADAINGEMKKMSATNWRNINQ